MPQFDISKSMFRYMLTGISETMEPEDALAVAYHGGFLAGEDHLFQFFNMEDPYPVFFEKLTKFCENQGLPKWEIRTMEMEEGHIQLSFDCIEKCRGRYCKKMPLNCEFMKGYLLGLIETYTQCNSVVRFQCDERHCPPSIMADKACLCDIQLYSKFLQKNQNYSLKILRDST